MEAHIVMMLSYGHKCNATYRGRILSPSPALPMVSWAGNNYKESCEEKSGCWSEAFRPHHLIQGNRTE